MRKNPTTAMIAEAANVSRASVYAVLNTPSKTNIGVSEEKRQRILDIANRLGYIRNVTARSLKTGKYNSIAVVAQSIAQAQFYRFFNAFDRQAGLNGYFTFLTSSEYDLERERQKLTAILEQGVDALVVGLIHHEQNYDVLEQYYRRNIPVVILGNVLGKNRAAHLVGFDEAAGARKLAEYLYAVGLDRLAYFQWFNDDRCKNSLFDARTNFFRAACTQLFPEAEIRLLACNRDEVDHAGEALVERLLTAPATTRPRAIVCSNDLLAFDAIAALERRGIRIPEDFAVIGYDNLDPANRFSRPVSTLDLPFEQLAEASWRLLARALDEPVADRDDAPSEPVLIPPRLLIRQTSPAWPDTTLS